MKKNLLPFLLATAMLAFTPCLQAKDKVEKTKGNPEVAESATTATKEVKEAGESKKEAGKGVKKGEWAKLKAAREAADKDPVVADLDAKDEAAKKNLKKLKAAKGTKPEDIIAADKAADAAHEAYIKARRDAIAKADPEMGKLDERAFAMGEGLHKAKDAKDKEADEAVEGAKGKGKGLEHAPGQLKKTEGGEATDFAPGKKKEKKNKKDKSDE